MVNPANDTVHLGPQPELHGVTETPSWPSVVSVVQDNATDRGA